MMRNLDLYTVTAAAVHRGHMSRLFAVSAAVLGTPRRWNAAAYRLPARFVLGRAA